MLHATIFGSDAACKHLCQERLGYVTFFPYMQPEPPGEQVFERS